MDLTAKSSNKDNSPFLVLQLPCNQAVDWLTVQLQLSNLEVLRTFDLQSSRQNQPLCPCPYHGTDHCDCQMVVLLIYQTDQVPIAITVHGNDQQTWFSFVDTPQQRADPHLEGIIRSLVAPRMVFPHLAENDAQPI